MHVEMHVEIPDEVEDLAIQIANRDGKNLSEVREAIVYALAKSEAVKGGEDGTEIPSARFKVKAKGKLKKLVGQTSGSWTDFLDKAALEKMKEKQS